jgi:hypothetical protein
LAGEDVAEPGSEALNSELLMGLCQEMNIFLKAGTNKKLLSVHALTVFKGTGIKVYRGKSRDRDIPHIEVNTGGPG